MLKKILLLLIISITIISALTTIKISSKENRLFNKINNIFKIDNSLIKKENEKLGNLFIKKINIEEPLYNVTSINNSVDKHVTILKESILPDQENSIIFLAAHSGTGKIAYFENLDKLVKNDEIILNIKNKIYKYYVKDIWEEKKKGFINVNKEKTNQLILTTCSPKHKNFQLVINCIEKNKNDKR